MSSKQFTYLTENSSYMNIKMCINIQDNAFRRLMVVLHGLPPDIGSAIIPIARQDVRDAAQSSYQVTNVGPGYAREIPESDDRSTQRYLSQS